MAKKKKATKFKATITKSGEIDVPELDDYDDSIEEVFQDND